MRDILRWFVRYFNDTASDQLLPSDFKGSNLRLGAPEGWDDVKLGECNVLYTQQVRNVIIKDSEGKVINYRDLPHVEYQSLWVLNWKQRLKILITGEVWLRMVGLQPPVTLTLKRIYGASTGSEQYTPKPVQENDSGYLQAILNRYRNRTFCEFSVDDCRTLINAYGDPLKVLPDSKNMDDPEYWQLQFRATLEKYGNAPTDVK